ncbi:MAG: PKD domain-containing protein, partial [Planctomycetes bacterium]|nr:PKD domain-containing protein [Planctomycetota bacterium]
NVDTAAVKIYCEGRASADGRDYRVLDAVGNPVPFQLTYHNADHYSLIAFRAAKPNAGTLFYVYFGNKGADRAKQQIIANDEPGAGPPKAGWIPRAGLVFSTMQRPQGENPKTVEELRKLIAGSKQRYGARYQRRVADGHNPFGLSDYYISVYRGWINIPRAGTYKFCTASNEASFSFLDGRKLVHWPGRHTSQRGLRGEKNETLQLTAGLHYLEYYHEEVQLKQVAFLGWSPPGSETGHFAAIPQSIYTVPHATSVVSYQGRNGEQLLFFEPDILDSIWPEDRHTGQYTRVRFQAGHHKSLPGGTTFRWDFGDGYSQTGATAEHVYLRLGQYDVTLTAEGPAGRSSVTWPLEIYEVQHVTDSIKQGRPPDYAKIAARYDPAKLDAASLKELAHLFAESDMPADALRVGRVFVDRFSDTHAALLPRVQRLMALCALETGEEGIDEAITNFEEGQKRPVHWQAIDGLSTFWVTDKDPQHRKVLKFDSDVLQSQAYAWWVKIADGVSPEKAPAKTPTTPPKYDTLAGLDGVWFWSDPIPVEKGKEYWLTLDAKGSGMLVWLVGYPNKPDTSFAADAGAVKQHFAKVKGTAPPNKRNRKAFIHKYVWKGQLRVGASKKWNTFSRRKKPFRPTKYTPNVRFVRVLLYPFWPPGEYYVDNVKLVEYDERIHGR